jgi:hypothetical protein
MTYALLSEIGKWLLALLGPAILILVSVRRARSFAQTKEAGDNRRITGGHG